MVQRLEDQRGMTIIETTVILSVLFILAGAMSPIIGDSVTMARAIKAKNDASMIAMGLINLQKDLGGDALAYSGEFSGASLTAVAGRLPDVLATDGNVPGIDDAETTDATTPSLPALLVRANGNANGNGQGNNGGSGAARAQRRKWLEEPTGLITDHLVTNRHGYQYRRPGEYAGWNGPYMSASVAGDPWGNKYLINSGWLDGGTTAADSRGMPRRAVYVVSPGADSVLQTPFEQPITDARAHGDDIVIRIQ